MERRSALLEAELARARGDPKSDRGLVVTLNDVLFDTGSATLRPGGRRLVARLAEFLREYPERTLAIEGFTDSVGDDAYNQELSERRAAAVRIAHDGGGNRRVAHPRRAGTARRFRWPATTRRRAASAIAASRS